MGALLVPIGLAAAFQLFRSRSNRGSLPPSRAVALVLAATAAGVFVVVSSELLSVAGRFDRGGITVAWAVFDVALLAAVVGSRRKGGAPVPPEEAGPAAGWTAGRLLSAGATGTWLLLLPLVAFVAQTNDDTLCYHLPRVMHWLQQGSLAPFATIDYRRIDFVPFSAMAVAHAYALADGDRLVGGVQWLASGLAAAAAGALAVRMLAGVPGTGRETRCRAAGMAALFTLTLPILLVQATTCQNDVTAAAWLAASALLGWWLVEYPGSALLTAGSAAALSLALLTKETTALVAFPLALALSLRLLLRRGPPLARGAWPAAFVLIFGVLGAGHAWRQVQVHGSVLAPTFARTTLRVADRSPSAVLSNVLRATSLYAATGVPALTGGVNAALLALHRGTGRALNDPATTYAGGTFALQEEVRRSDSFVNTPWSLLAVLLAASLVPWLPPPARRRTGAWLALVAAGALLLTAEIRWQEFNVRFHISLFVLAAPAVGAALALLAPPAALAALGGVLAWSGGSTLALNETRPLLPVSRLLARPRVEQLFAGRPDLLEPYRSVATGLALTGCRDVLLGLAFREPEYPFWVLLGGVRGPFRLRTTGSAPGGASGELPPCAIVTSREGLPDAKLPDATGPGGDLLPDVASFGALRIHVDPSGSGRWTLAQVDAAGGASGVRIGGTVDLARGPARFALLTLRPGVFTLELGRSAAGRGGRKPTSLRAVTGSGEPMTLEPGPEAVRLSAAVPGGLFRFLLSDPTAGEGDAELSVRSISFRAAPSGWAALYSVGGRVPAPGEPLPFEVGPDPVPIVVLSRRGGVVTLRGVVRPVVSGEARGSGREPVLANETGVVETGPSGEFEIRIASRTSSAATSLRAISPGAAARLSVSRLQAEAGGVASAPLSLPGGRLR